MCVREIMRRYSEFVGKRGEPKSGKEKCEIDNVRGNCLKENRRERVCEMEKKLREIVVMGGDRVNWCVKKLIDVKGRKGERCTMVLVESENV